MLDPFFILCSNDLFVTTRKKSVKYSIKFGCITLKAVDRNFALTI